MTGADGNKILNTGWAGRFSNDAYEGFPDNYPNAAMPDPLDTGSAIQHASYCISSVVS